MFYLSGILLLGLIRRSTTTTMEIYIYDNDLWITRRVIGGACGGPQASVSLPSCRSPLSSWSDSVVSHSSGVLHDAFMGGMLGLAAL